MAACSVIAEGGTLHPFADDAAPAKLIILHSSTSEGKTVGAASAAIVLQASLFNHIHIKSIPASAF